MKKIFLFFLSFTMIYLLSGCNFDSPKDDRYSIIPWDEKYDTYDEMLKDYKEYNPNYENIYLDPFEELNPTCYLIDGNCYCMENRQKNHQNGRCLNLKNSLPGIVVEDEKISGEKKYKSVYKIWFFEKIDIEDVTKIEYGENFSNYDAYKEYFHSYISNDYFIYYEDKIIFTLSFQSLSQEEKEIIINKIIEHIKTKYVN